VDNQDVLQFLEGMNPANVSVSRTEDNLCLTIEDKCDVITVSRFF
jgi:hypothetical protein